MTIAWCSSCSQSKFFTERIQKLQHCIAMVIFIISSNDDCMVLIMFAIQIDVFRTLFRDSLQQSYDRKTLKYVFLQLIHIVISPLAVWSFCTEFEIFFTSCRLLPFP